MRVFARNGGIAAIVAFHALLLWQRCADASILEPVVFAKYAGAALLLIGAAIYRRLSSSRIPSRRAILVFWLIALLLHAVAPFGAETRDIVELGLTLPIAFVIVAFIAELVRSLRAVHGIRVANGFATLTPQLIRIPSRAPPLAR